MVSKHQSVRKKSVNNCPASLMASGQGLMVASGSVSYKKSYDRYTSLVLSTAQVCVARGLERSIGTEPGMDLYAEFNDTENPNRLSRNTTTGPLPQIENIFTHAFSILTNYFTPRIEHQSNKTEVDFA